MCECYMDAFAGHVYEWETAYVPAGHSETGGPGFPS